MPQRHLRLDPLCLEKRTPNSKWLIQKMLIYSNLSNRPHSLIEFLSLISTQRPKNKPPNSTSFSNRLILRPNKMTCWLQEDMQHLIEYLCPKLIQHSVLIHLDLLLRIPLRWSVIQLCLRIWLWVVRIQHKDREWIRPSFKLQGPKWTIRNKMEEVH